MLEKQGFRYEGDIDPFDGGPYLEALRDEIPLVRATGSFSLGGSEGGFDRVGIISCNGDLGFRAVRSEYRVEGDSVMLPQESVDTIGAGSSDRIGVTPL